MTRLQIIRTVTLVAFNTIWFLFLMIELLRIFDGLDLLETATNSDIVFFFGSVFFYLYFYTGLMMILCCCFYQYRALNSFLKSCLENPQRASIPRVIKKSAIMHDQMCDIYDAISAFYLLNNYVFLIGFSYFSIFFGYSIYISAQNPNYRLSCFMITSFLWIFYYAPCVIWTVTYAGWTRDESCKASDLIQKLANNDLSKKNFKISTALMLQMTHRRPKISCGLFDLNWKHFFFTLGEIFTFIIILIQFYDVAQS